MAHVVSCEAGQRTSVPQGQRKAADGQDLGELGMCRFEESLGLAVFSELNAEGPTKTGKMEDIPRASQCERCQTCLIGRCLPHLPLKRHVKFTQRHVGSLPISLVLSL